MIHNHTQIRVHHIMTLVFDPRSYGSRLSCRYYIRGAAIAAITGSNNNNHNNNNNNQNNRNGISNTNNDILNETENDDNENSDVCTRRNCLSTSIISPAPTITTTSNSSSMLTTSICTPTTANNHNRMSQLVNYCRQNKYRISSNSNYSRRYPEGDYIQLDNSRENLLDVDFSLDVPLQ
jgi:hypothetical protein